MSKAVKTVFGGTDDSSQKAQKSANAASKKFIEQMQTQARSDAIPLFGAAQQNINKGAQAALDVYSKALPQQTQAIESGSRSAQAMLLAGFPQIQNAILGLPVNTQGAQPLTYSADTSFAQQQLPQFNLALPQTTQTPLAAQSTQVNPDQLAALLAGRI